MTEDLFERRLRRNLDAVAGSIPVGAPVRTAGSRRRSRVAVAAGVGTAAAAVAGVAFAVTGSEPPDSVVAGHGGPCPARPATAPEVGEGEFLVDEGQLGAHAWEVRTTGIDDGQPLRISKVLGDESAGGMETDAGSFIELSWSYDISRAGVLLYGFVPREATEIRLADQTRTWHVCPVSTGDELGYFAAAFSQPPTQVEVLDAAGELVARHRPDLPAVPDLGARGLVVQVPVTDRVTLPIGGRTWEPPPERTPAPVVAEGRTSGVAWELRADHRGMELIPAGTELTYPDGNDPDLRYTPRWVLDRTDDLLFAWGQLPPGTIATVRVELADGTTIEAPAITAVDPEDPFAYFVAVLDTPHPVVRVEALAPDGEIAFEVDETTEPALVDATRPGTGGIDIVVDELRL